MKFVDDAVSRQAAEDRDAELLAWPDKLITNNEYVFGELIMYHPSFKMGTLLLRGGGSGKGM